MKIRILSEKSDKFFFNRLAPHPLQSWEWGEARREMGIEVLRITDEKNVFQITFHKIPFTPFKIGYLPRSVFPEKNVLDFLIDYGKKNNIFFIKIEPYSPAVIPSGARDLATVGSVKKSNYASLDSSVAPLLRKDKRFVKSPHPLFPEWTQIIDLSKTEDELLKNMHPKTRYNIKLAQKKGVTVKEMSVSEGFKIFTGLYFETCKRQKYFGHDTNYHKIAWKNLKNNIAHILIAYYNDVPLAVFELFFFKNILYYPYGGTSLQFRNLMASNLLMWKAIQFGKKLNAEKFDLWGSLPPTYPQSHTWSGFTRFKEGYGGKFTELTGSYDLIINPFGYKLYNQFFIIRDIYLKLRRTL